MPIPKPLAVRLPAVHFPRGRWRPLDASLGGGKDAFTNQNPSYQIFYVQHAGTEWGILTNGRLWCLYHRDTAHKLDRFYEADLHELATAGYVQSFLYFYAFFRREAFDDHPLAAGRCCARARTTPAGSATR